MPQNLIPFNQLPTLSTNNESINTRLPPIQTLTQYCCPSKPVPFVPFFPSSNNSQLSIPPPSKTSFVFHQVNPNNLFPTPVPTFQQSKYNLLNENQPVANQQKKTSQSYIPNHLTFVNMELSTKKFKSTLSTTTSIENSFQVSNVGSSSDFRKPLVVNTPIIRAESNSTTQHNFDSSIRRKNKKQPQEASITMENPQEESNPFRTGSSNRNLPKAAVTIMKDWLFNHQENPYPTEEEKLQIQNQTGLSQKRINYWFINARRRLLPTSENKKRPVSSSSMIETTPSSLTKRLRKNSVISSISNVSSSTIVSSYTTNSCASSSTVVSTSSSGTDEEESLSQSSNESIQAIDSWVVDCLLNLRK